MPWSPAEHARALLQQDTLSRPAELALRRIAGEEVPASLPTGDELTFVAKVVSAEPVIHRFGEVDGRTRCGSTLTYGTRNALLPYAHAASFAVDCEAGCFT